MRAYAVGATLIGFSLLLIGCESTQSRSAALEAAAADAVHQKGVEVRKANPDLEVRDVVAIQDKYGAAVAVEVRNKSQQDLRAVPISIDVKDQKGKTVFQNNLPGLETALVSVPVIRAGQTVDWVDDQVLVNGEVKSATAKLGEGEPLPPGSPEIDVGEPKLKVDSVSGVEATGDVTNRSDVDQQKLVLFAVARKGGRVVAAGRGAIERLKAGKSLPYHIFFIGNPRGAELTVTAPPSTFQPGGAP